MVTTTLLNLTKGFEDCRLEAYPDPVSGGDPWTVGYGATGPDIVEGTVWTQDQADSDIVERLQTLQHRIQAIVTTTITQNQLDALTDFAYNVGFGALESSFLLKCVNAGNFEAAADQFCRWDHAGGKEIPGLLKRRQAEAALFELADDVD